ncbi:thioesterase family protein [Bacillus sp. Marseille-P3800]|uniref:thioesterase family protein n=1 Tax=Bacillus sp. Marseille-P3800 TaxID=2014782 RepID=UPI000C07FBF2|nr:thioesterase family protein [Bacillus sp. Marseille-P3800]
MKDSHNLWKGQVLPEWVDYNGHMNDAEYARVFSLALEELMAFIGLDESGRERHHYTIFTLENHIKYLAEAHQDESLLASALILDRDSKRIHVWVELKNRDHHVIATSEQMIMGMSQTSHSPAPFPKEVEEKITHVPHAKKSDWPKAANTVIGIRRK